MKTKKEYVKMWSNFKVKIMEKKYVDGLLSTAKVTINNKEVTLEQGFDYSLTIAENETNFSNAYVCGIIETNTDIEFSQNYWAMLNVL